MISPQAKIAIKLLKTQKKFLMLHPNNTQFMRQMFEKVTQFAPKPRYIQAKESVMNNIPMLILHNQSKNTVKARILFYIHGGGFVIGSPHSYQSFVGALCKLCQAEFAYLPDYRLAPEYPHPAGLEDVFTAWNALVEKFPEHEILLAGDSAGGNLSLALSLMLRDRGLTQPKKIYLQSPWLDLTLTSESLIKNDQYDAVLGLKFLERDFARHYAQQKLRTTATVSPLYADFTGLPEIFVHAGAKEVLLDDSSKFAEKAQAQNVSVTLSVWEGMWHAWLLIPFVPESRQAMREAGLWLGQI